MQGDAFSAQWQALTEEVLSGMQDWRTAPPKATFAEIEAAVDERLARMRARMLEAAALASAATDMSASEVGGRPTCPQCGQALVARGQRERRLRVPGQQTVTLRRSYAVCSACGVGLFPLDEELALGPEHLSPWLVEATVRLGTWMPFERVPAALAFFAGQPIDADTARQLTEAAGAAWERAETALVERLEQTQPEAPAGPDVQQLSADGAMVPLVGGEWAEVKALAVGRVVERRTAAGERVVQTEDRSYFSRLTDHTTFARLAWGELHWRETPRAGRVAGVMDSSEWLQAFLDYHRPDAVRILDFPHAVEHLSAAAEASLGRDSPATTVWVAAAAHELKTGEPAAVLAAVCALPTAQAADPAKAPLARDQTVNYLAKRWAQMRYAQFQAEGYPIGSGAVESANTLVVEARLKGSGMHWARAKVTPMLALRDAACSDRREPAWAQLCQQRQEQRAASRHGRWAAKRPALPQRPTTQPGSAGVLPPTLAGPVPPTPRGAPRVVGGRPTASHP